MLSFLHPIERRLPSSRTHLGYNITLKVMFSTCTPQQLWDYCGRWASGVRRRTELDIPDLNGLTLEECIHGRMVDISSYAQFDWYSLVWYIDESTDAATHANRLVDGLE
jgi:hypothetical protein